MLLRAFPLWSSTGWMLGLDDRSREALGLSPPHFLFTLHAGEVSGLELRPGLREVNFPVGLHCSVSIICPSPWSPFCHGGSLLTLSWGIGRRFSGGSWGAHSWKSGFCELPLPPPHNPLLGSPSPQTLSAGVFVQESNLLDEQWQPVSLDPQLFRSLNPQEICVTCYVDCHTLPFIQPGVRGPGPRGQAHGQLRAGFWPLTWVWWWGGE